MTEKKKNCIKRRTLLHTVTEVITMSFFPKDTIPDTALLNINPVTEPEKKPEKEPPVQDPYGTDDTAYPDIKACSATDCTGLIPSLPQSEAELESYAEIYHYPADIFHD